jgi:hypothetical protein
MVCVLTMVHYCANLFFKAIHKIPHLLNVQRVCQLKTLLAVIFHFDKGRKIWFSILFLGLGFLCLFLFCISILDNACVGPDLGGSAIVSWNLDLLSFRASCSHPSWIHFSRRHHGPLKQLFWGNLGNSYSSQRWDGHCQIGIGKKGWFDFFLSNHCN